MKKILPLILLCLFFFSSCFLTSKTKQADLAGRDGSSIEKAIIIMEKTESTGIEAEYKWIALNYPGYTASGQALVTHKKHPYDIIYIKTASGVSKEIYFDISNYFGKW